MPAVTDCTRPRSACRRAFALIFLAAVGLGLAGSASAAESTEAAAVVRKLDAPLRLFVEQPDTALRLYAERVEVHRGLRKSASTGRLTVLIRIAEPVDEAQVTLALQGAGADVRGRLGPIVTADVPIVALRSLAALDVVVSIELAQPVTSRLNVSVAATGATTLRSGSAPNLTGTTGKGVIVGVIDDGIDFRHRDFRNPDGSTRLLALWDQRATGASGSPPAGYAYGGECTPAMINAAIAGDAAACTQPSSGGHGTHVAGIAAGNGQGTGNGQPGYRFIGMAPEADILSANGGTNASVLDAIAWMKAKAKAAGKPLAINMSFGSYFGARDGTSNYEVGLSSAGEAGVILAAAAGNEATDRIRAEGPLAQGGQLVFEVNVPPERRPGEPTTFVQMEAWYPGTNSYGVTIQGPNCPATPLIGTDSPDAGFETACGLIGALNAGPFTSNDDRQLQVIMRNGQSPLAFGTWRITFAGTQVAGGSATVSVVTAEDAGGMTINTVNGQPPPALTTQILTDTSGARRVLAVASYNTNYSWTTSLGGPSDPSPVWGPVGDLSNFSSRGPRRMCSNPAKCPQVMKPEITAPGAMIMSSLAVDQPASATTPAAREADGVHVALNGTSMATPHVTGALALLLQRRPTLTPEDAKQVLFANVQKTSFTPALPAYTGADVPAAPDHAWGYGVLDVAKAAVSLAPPSYQGLWWNAQESGWGLNFAHQGDVIFVTWFTYGADNTAQWFASVARKSADNALVYSGTLGTFTGPPYNTVPFPPNANVRTPGRERDDHLRRGRQERDLRLHGERHRADQADHAPGVLEPGADVRLGRAAQPVARDQLPGPMVGHQRRRVGLGHQLHPPGQGHLRDVVHLRLERQGDLAVRRRVADGGAERVLGAAQAGRGPPVQRPALRPRGCRAQHRRQRDDHVHRWQPGHVRLHDRQRLAVEEPLAPGVRGARHGLPVAPHRRRPPESRPDQLAADDGSGAPSR